jgi:hypothetical protein
LTDIATTNPDGKPLTTPIQLPAVPTITPEQLQAELTKAQQAIAQLTSQLSQLTNQVAQLTSQLSQLTSNFSSHVHHYGIPMSGVINIGSLLAQGTSQNTLVFVAPGDQLQDSVQSTGAVILPNAAAHT